MTEDLTLGFDLRFEDLYSRDGLVRLDRCFVDVLKVRDADLHNRLMVARAAPDQIAGKAESDLWHEATRGPQAVSTPSAR